MFSSFPTKHGSKNDSFSSAVKSSKPTLTLLFLHRTHLIYEFRVIYEFYCVSFLPRRWYSFLDVSFLILRFETGARQTRMTNEINVGFSFSVKRAWTNSLSDWTMSLRFKMKLITFLDTCPATCQKKNAIAFLPSPVFNEKDRKGKRRVLFERKITQPLKLGLIARRLSRYNVTYSFTDRQCSFAQGERRVYSSRGWKDKRTGSGPEFAYVVC